MKNNADKNIVIKSITKEVMNLYFSLILTKQKTMQ